LWDLKKALSQMDGVADRVTVAMATVDPERDSDATMLGYLQSFFEEGHPLRTEDIGALEAVGDAFGADFEVIKTAKGGVEVLHTAYLYAIDDAGLIQRVWPFGVESDVIADGLSGLLASKS
jgi:protein SCO1/2